MSREITLATEKQKLEEKFVKEMGHEAAAKFVSDHEGMTKEQLEARMLELAKTRQGIINTKNSDEVLSDLKAQVRSHGKKYSDQLKGNDNLTRFAALLMSEKFGDKLMDLQTPAEDEDEE